jgi:hypothetical protein
MLKRFVLFMHRRSVLYAALRTRWLKASTYTKTWLLNTFVSLDLDDKTGKDSYGRWVAVCYLQELVELRYAQPTIPEARARRELRKKDGSSSGSDGLIKGRIEIWAMRYL